MYVFCEQCKQKIKTKYCSTVHSTRYVGLNWYAVKAKCILHSHKQASKYIYLQNEIAIFSPKTFLQAVWLPAGKSILFFYFEKERNMPSSSLVTQQLYQFVFTAVISIIVVDYLHLAQNINNSVFFIIKELENDNISQAGKDL